MASELSTGRLAVEPADKSRRFKTKLLATSRFRDPLSQACVSMPQFGGEDEEQVACLSAAPSAGGMEERRSRRAEALSFESVRFQGKLATT